MSTRYQETPGPPSQERYMSSNEFAELRAVSGIAVSARAAVLISARKKNLLWFIQGLSLAEGGLKRVAKELIEIFPERIGTPEMHDAQIKPEKTYPGELVATVKKSLGLMSEYSQTVPPPQRGAALIQLCQEFALRHRNHSETPVNYNGERELPSLEEFLVDLCVNPRIYFPEPGEKTDFSSVESDMAIEEHPELSRTDFTKARLFYFRDIVGALFEYQARYEAKAGNDFQLTAIGKKIWDTLDYALRSRGMVVLDGLEGRGKTEAVKAWCATRLGAARFVSLKGIASTRSAFREIAKALGIASSYTRKAPEMQARIEDVLKRSKLMLVVDEAHFLFNQSRRMYSRPELVDWIDTAICNQGVPIALCTTPQFIVCMTRAADQVDWNYRQFRRRVKRWEKLPASNSEEDIKAVARNVFKKADARIISKIAGYALLSKRDLSAIGDVASEVRAMLGSDDLSKATLDHVHRAIYDFLLPSDKTFLEGMAAARNTGRKHIRKQSPALPESPESELMQEENPQPGSRTAAITSEPRSRRGDILELAKA
jgi:hypothetical protein